LVLPVEEGALMMVEPPCQAGIAGIFEVYDGVFISVELDVDEELSCAMSQTFILDIRVRPDSVTEKIGEHRGGSQAIKTVVVIVNLHLHRNRPVQIGMAARRAEKEFNNLPHGPRRINRPIREAAPFS